ncbi:MAG: translation initiation factor IF-2 [Candidatus Aminicenantes bacterium]|nr:translation initiation factor IF-2 [Candidatus Aminicenantes bacterium]
MPTKPKDAGPKKPVKEAMPKFPAKVTLTEGADVRTLCDALKVAPRAVLEKLAAKGYSLSSSDIVDEALAGRLSKDLGLEIEMISLEQAARRDADSRPADKVVRPPVVTIMGHVDHGKTTLLDAIRASNLVDKESGGITQHIGAYRAKFGNRSITFIDTPGHEAFTQLRARGAKITDIVVLVVAADEGLMPQTKEAINHARAAGVPIITAINKIDKPEANVERIKQQLSKEGLLVEDWGGQTVSIEVSAKEKKNIKELLDMIVLVADMAEIKGNPKVPAQGVIVEARLDAKKGPLATVIIRQGTLHQGEAFIAGTIPGKVRAMFDENSTPLKITELSMPVEILGFDDVPQAGEIFQVVSGQEEARRVVQLRIGRLKKEEPERSSHVTLDDLFKRIEEGAVKELRVVLKADVQGSVEVLRELLPSLSTDKVKVVIIHAATGQITDNDVLLASASNAVIIGYNTKAGAATMDVARRESVDIRLYRIIYQLTDDLKKAMLGMLEPTAKETYLGRAEVRKVFKISKIGQIAGCLVTDGKISRNAEIRVVRNKEIIHKGRMASLKRLKDNAAEVKKDLECGIALEKFKEFQEGDLLEAYLIEKVRPT